MKIVRVEPDRVRVYLSEGDLLEMRIDVDSITPDSPKLGEFLCRILEAVKTETGFSADGGQIIAEATPRTDGIVIDLLHANKIKKSESVRLVKKDSIVFKFIEFESLTGMLKNISPTHLLSMRLYTYNGNYYVTVPKKRVPAIIYEYSLASGKSAVAESKIAEYGRLVAGGYRLISMATALKKIN